MTFPKLFACTWIFTTLLSFGAHAQSEISRNAIINSLQGAQSKINVSAAELRMHVRDRISKLTEDDGANVIPLAVQLDKLRQFNVEVLFAPGSARIGPDSYETIGTIADALHSPYLIGQRFFVIGHTDAAGTREANLQLSERRAEAIRDALVTKFRVSQNKLEAIGFGEEQLRDPSRPNHKVNRRVQLINVGY